MHCYMKRTHSLKCEVKNRYRKKINNCIIRLSMKPIKNNIKNFLSFSFKVIVLELTHLMFFIHSRSKLSQLYWFEFLRPYGVLLFSISMTYLPSLFSKFAVKQIMQCSFSVMFMEKKLNI